MSATSKYGTIVLTAIAIVVAGCATIVGDKTQLVSVASTPDEAVIDIKDEKGIAVFKGKTPATVTLDKSNGTYWGKKSYVVTITKPGFQPQTVQLNASANGWYIGGNIIFGGLIGWFIVDPFNGAMYTLSPKAISAGLTESAAALPPAKDGGIAVVLLRDVPEELRDQMVRVN